MILISDTVQQIANMKPRKIIQQILNIGMIIGSALFVWHLCILASNCETPIVVVLSGIQQIKKGSMEPAYFRGDILFVSNYNKKVQVGDVIVFKMDGEPIPIVHRALVTQAKGLDDQYILTKGDNNYIDDRGLYPNGQIWLHKKDIMGKIEGYIPYFGYFTIMLNDFPQIKYALLGFMAFWVLIAKDPQV